MSDTLQSPAPQEGPVLRAEAREWHFHEVMSVMYRRRWIMLATFLIVAAGVVAYTITATPIYEARAQLLLDKKPSIVAFDATAPAEPGNKPYLETQHRILRSRSLTRRVIDRLNLWQSPPPDAGAQGNSATRQVKSWLEGTRASVASPAQPDDPASTLSPEGTRETRAESATIDRVQSNIRIVPVPDTYIVEVRYESSNPELATRIVNTLMDEYIKQKAEARTEAAKEATMWLTDQLDVQRRKVEASELALQRYREKENSLSLDAGQNIVVQRLNTLNAAVTTAKTDLIAAEALYRQISANEGNREALDTLAPVRANAVIQEIRGRLANLQRERAQFAGSLGTKHPEMIRIDTAIAAAERELSAELAKTVQSVRQDYLNAASRERELTAALDKQKANALALNRQGIEYGVLLREVESNRQIYQSLLQRSNETAVSSELKGSSVEVLDAAEVPRRPVRPNTRANLLAGFVLSIVLAIAAAFLREMLESRVQTPADVKSLGIPFLGMLPYVRGRQRKGSTLLLSKGVPAAYAEACRGLRTNIIASGGGNGGRSILVTSAAPGDGKSMVAVNLAVALGRSGARVLIVDADMRRPVVHQLLESKQQPGLAEVLAGVRKPSEAIAATQCSGVWLLSSGAGVSNPSEQLGSRRFRELLKKLTESFDWVIIDSPPVMAVTDPAVIAKLASGVLFVVNARRTKQRVAQAALDQLETAGATFAGAVLNAVTLERDHYYNSRYYLPYYSDYRTGGKRTA